jgi:hypothetical protein
VRAEEGNCIPYIGTVIPPVLAGINVEDYWEVERRGPEWDGEVTILATSGDQQYPRQIKKRQSLSALKIFPKASYGHRWTLTDGRTVTWNSETREDRRSINVGRSERIRDSSTVD